MNLFNKLFNSKKDNSNVSDIMYEDSSDHDNKIEYKREFISNTYSINEMDNIFFESTIPIVKDLKKVICYTDTILFKNPDKSEFKQSVDYFYYNIDSNFKKSFLEIVDELNSFVRKYNLGNEFLLNIRNINFSQTKATNIKTLPLSTIIYDENNHLLKLKFSNEVKVNDEYALKNYGIKQYNYLQTEYGEIVFDENGNKKNAKFTKEMDNGKAIARFKGYKTGFDLYDLRYNGSVIYKRS
ncbi:hypothetical protein ACTQ6A_02940 [Lachnospiraceae bacterium LCP25S3_G4]